MKNIELPFIKDMFENIAPSYDLLNRLLSLRQDIYWRKKMVSAIKISDTGTLLDVACGTGDVALEIIRQKGSGVNVFGIDFSTGMLTLARDKIDTENASANIHLLTGNAFNLPFRKKTFDAITIAFGIRNINDKLSVMKEFHTRLKTGGMLLVLELAIPDKDLFLSIYRFYFKAILPFIGWLFSKNSMAYQYLPASVANFPNPDNFAATMRLAGFQNVAWKKLTFGIANLYAGYKKK
ncbi:MAG: bifunctional demethylmenaquinone methyltransferase/2-methoxy-6-polyprenyl-1,4-benzoquinol methylase UbiE [Deltaproteobacteria bacterium]|nr:bifunctional demethylmenaquinone methyltransferase/2-methoxy-6-polyprenyl-1,4-benzoquinol methylase UbiE [Deltaproteobacteria bacterium]MBW2661285.1 bifunctional demethylmenaquinone methyltransferase/2-methoxy-6-polyprenyl-1,4-benzoquinol methylase UbiE [Deltaproteobacteria bacterium]